MRVVGARDLGARVVVAAAMIALLAGPAFAQMPNINLIPEVVSKTQDEKDAEAARDKAYKESLRKIPDAKTSTDPWGNVRTTDAPKTSAPAKPRTKTGSTAN
jgi:beta-lactam-binding protein with PASTA domain